MHIFRNQEKNIKTDRLRMGKTYKFNIFFNKSAGVGTLPKI